MTIQPIQHRFSNASTQTASEVTIVNPKRPGLESITIAYRDCCDREPAVEVHNFYKIVELVFKRSFKTLSENYADKETSIRE